MTENNTFLNQNKERFLNELIAILKIPSISADTAYTQDVLNCAEAIAASLRSAKIDHVEICETKGYPIIYGDKLIDSKLPTVLIYGHYDVQPPDPLELWESGPFEPIIKNTPIHPDGAIFARGSADDKGQIFMHIKAVESMIKTNTLPCNVKFLIEGEEEVGSSSLGDFLEHNKDKFANNIILISDTDILSNDHPSLTVGLRGLSYVEVSVEGPNRDLHSGLYGGGVPNPINILAQMIASLHDKNGRIMVEGFYDKVIELSSDDKNDYSKLPFDIDKWKKSIGLNDVEGEKGYSTIERISIRPTLDVNGIWGGYTGEGAKTVIPSKAFAKISMRLVPHQDSEEITTLFKKHFESIAPKSVKVEVKAHHGGLPYVLPSSNIGYQAAKQAMEVTFGKEILAYRGGGSIPIVALFEKTLNSKSVLMGFGLDTDAIHSPNEHFGLFNFYKGIETIPYFFKFFVEKIK